MTHRFALPSAGLAAVLWFSCAHAAQALQSANLVDGSVIDPGSTGIGADSADSDAYVQGTRAINDGRWSDAVTIFSQVANQAGEHADGAIYWKAYAQDKLGQSNTALDTCAALRRDHPGSKWIEECGALEIEIHSKNGHPVQPDAQQSDDLKLLALAALMQHDEKAALAEIDQILNSSDSSEKLKHGALLVMGEHHTDTVYPQIARVSIVEGDVRVARGIENKHKKDATWEKAEADLPLESGYSLVTGIDGRAEIEFEDASTMYLAENSVLQFNDLSTTAGVPHTEVALLSGTATLHVRPYVVGEMFLLRTLTDSNLLTQYPQSTNLRITSYTDGMAVTPIGQQRAIGIGIAGMKESLSPGQTLYFKDSRRIMMAGPFHAEDFSAWDQWVETRYTEREKELAAVLKDSGLATPVPGMAEMQGQGRFFACEPYGTCWEPTPASETKPVTESVVAGSSSGQVSSGQVSSGSQAQTTAPNATGTKPARQIGFVGKPMPNISASPSADMNAFWACLPGGLVPAAGQYQMQPWAWAVCHSGEWLYRDNNYAWVVGRRHHHPPCHWAKSGNRVVLIPTHPRDVKGHPPVNRVNPVVAVNAKGLRPIERVELGSHASVGLMKEPPKEFRAESVRPLTPVAEPHMVAFRVQDATVAKGGPVRPGTPITFNAHRQSFMMTQHEMHGDKSVAVSVPVNNHAGDLQGHGSFGGSGGAGHGGFNGGGGGGGVAHSGGGGNGSIGGGAHASAPSASSGGASSSASAASGGGSHH
jgi:FecR protein